MSDNFVTNPGAGGVTFASEDAGGVHYPYALIAMQDKDGNPVPVSHTFDSMLRMQSQLLAAQPRLDSAMRMTVNIETGTLPTVTTVTTVGTVNNIAAIGGRPADQMISDLNYMAIGALMGQIGRS